MGRRMKDSCIEWIGKIPADWSIVPIRYAFSEVKEKNTDGNITNTFQFKFGNIIPKIGFNVEDDDYWVNTISSYTVVNPNTIMINGLNLNYDFKTLRVGLVRETGTITSAYMAIKPNEDVILPGYALYLFKGYESKMAFHNMGAGIRLTLGFKELKNQPLLLPLMSEQRKIYEYLEGKNVEIDTIIARTKATIDEYKKLKQSIITEIVTKGVHGCRPMRSSDIAGIDSIPADWCCTKLKYLATLRSGITLGKKYPYDVELVEVPYLRVANVQGSYVDLDDVTTLSAMPEEVEKYRLHAGEVLMTEGGDRDKLGRGCVWNGELDPCLHQNHVFAVQTNEEKLLGQFLAYMTASTVARTYFDVTAKKTTNLCFPGCPDV